MISESSATRTSPHSSPSFGRPAFSAAPNPCATLSTAVVTNAKVVTVRADAGSAAWAGRIIVPIPAVLVPLPDVFPPVADLLPPFLAVFLQAGHRFLVGRRIGLLEMLEPLSKGGFSLRHLSAELLRVFLFELQISLPY